ncbi:hypothetical protein [Prochlorococcus marinus]|uniref:hypothetical protein n=1 Tax=Prochlorococcus marinus TaxID=1219 RepID=UPI001F492DA2|nr:hypothetical protein [Prochlorococcus marinus]
MRSSPHPYELTIVVGIAILLGGRFSVFTLRPVFISAIALLLTLTESRSQRRLKPSRSSLTPIRSTHVNRNSQPAPIPEWGPHAHQLSSTAPTSRLRVSPPRARKKLHPLSSGLTKAGNPD